MREITVSNTNLFRVAADLFGDALQWIIIARLNDISDPVISGVATLKVPAATPGPSDGIGLQ